MITELRPGRGRIEVKATGTAEWRVAGPLLALRAGDVVRATDDAVALIVLTGTRDTVRVDAATSPHTVSSGRVDQSRVRKGGTLLAASVKFLAARTPEVPRAVLATRTSPRPPVLVTPRNTLLLPGLLTFEWLGNASPHTLRVSGPSGAVLERGDVVGGRLAYPADSAPLTPGVRYSVRVLAGPLQSDEVWFEIVPAQRATALREALVELERELDGVGPSSRVAITVGWLVSQGLTHDARPIVLEALAREPDEPTLHALLAVLYASGGLDALAADEFREAERLARSRQN